VKRYFTIRRLVAIVMIVGIAMAPLARPVMAGLESDVAMDDTDTVSVAAGAGEMAVDMPGEMAMDMPCCPAKAPAPLTCDKCVLMAGCMSQCVADLPTTGFQIFATASDNVARLRNDSRPDGLGHPPPEHPPRYLI
jgi:hypothetical protein